jgi:L-ascorbate metabolism protein UlaG (beta-lactamase superfamily)
MLRWFAILLAALVLLPGLAAAQGKAPKHVEIIWHGQSYFEIHSTKGTIIVLDPHALPEYGRLLRPPKADLVLISHEHTDHNALEALGNKDSKKLKVIRGLKGAGPRATWNIVNETVKDVKVRSVGVYHDTVEGMKNGKNTVFIVEVDGWRIVHLGDLGHVLTKAQIKQVGPVDVLMIPVGGVYTINGTEAKEVVAQLKPKEYIIPMHFGTPVFDDLLSAAEFLDEQPKANVAISKDNRLVLNRDPQRPRPLIVKLHYWGRVRQDQEKGK